MKFNNVANNFTSGVWSPKMRARTEVEQYQNACEILKNFQPRIQGGAYRRGGLGYVNIPDSNRSDISYDSVLAPFQGFSGSKNYGLVINGTSITNWFIFDADVPTITFSVASTLSFSLPSLFLNESYHTAALGDVLLLVHSGGVHEPLILYPTSNSTSAPGFTISTLREYVSTVASTGGTVKEWQAYPYKPIQGLNATVTLSVGGTVTTGGTCTITSSAPFFAITGFHVGALFKFTAGGVTGAVRILTTPTTGSATALVLSTVSATTYGAGAAGRYFEESVWSNHLGWPRTVTGFQGRIIYGGSKSQPDTLWGSRIGNLFDLMEIPFSQDASFSSFLEDNSRPFTLSPNTTEVSSIAALTAGKTLIVLTNKYEIVASGAQGALGPNDASFESSTSFGALSVQPERINNYIIFSEVSGKKIRDMLFNFDQNEYRSSDISFVADHLFTTGTIIKFAGDRKNSVLYILKTTGELVGVSLDREYKVNGFHSFETSGQIHSVMSGGQNNSKIFVLTSRISDPMDVGTLRYNLEQLSDVFDADLSNFSSIATYIDSWITDSDITPKTTWSNFLPLYGFTVQVIADGHFIGEKLISDLGVLELDEAASTVLVGIKYESIIKPMPVEIGNQFQNGAQGLFKRIHEITIKFWNTYGAQYGWKESELYKLDFFDPNAVPSTPPVFFTGLMREKFPSDYGQEVQPIIKQDKPWPCNILAIISKGETYD